MFSCCCFEISEEIYKFTKSEIIFTGTAMFCSWQKEWEPSMHHSCTICITVYQLFQRRWWQCEIWMTNTKWWQHSTYGLWWGYLINYYCLFFGELKTDRTYFWLHQMLLFWLLHCIFVFTKSPNFITSRRTITCLLRICHPVL